MNLIKRIDDVYGELNSLPTDEVRNRLRGALSLAAESIRVTAAAIRILEERGEDLSELKLAAIEWFRKVAYGQLLPETFSEFRDNRRLFLAVADLPTPDQQRILSGHSLPVLCITNGAVSERQVAPREMQPDEIRQVFAKGKIRSLAEQRGWLESKRKNVPVTRELESGVTVNPRKRCLVINGMEISRSQLLSYLSQLGD